MAKFIVKKGSFAIAPLSAPLSITAATAGSTTALTVNNTLAVNDYVYITKTGWASLDDKIGKVTVASATSITVDLNSTGETATLGAQAQLVGLAIDDFIEDCVAGIEIAGAVADSVSVGTICDSSAALAGAAGAQTATLTGFIDYVDPGYQEMQAAVVDGLPRAFKFTMPQAANPTASTPPVMVFIGTLSGIDESFQTGAAAAFTAPVTLASAPVVKL